MPTEQQDAKSSRKTDNFLSYALVGVFLACIVIVVLMLMGPAIGNINSNIVAALNYSGSSYGYVDPGLAARPDAMEVFPHIVIREGHISLVVEDTRAVWDVVKELVEDMGADGAFVVTSEEWASSEDRSPEIRMTIRVPAAQFDAVMDRLAELAVRVVERRETADDVTEEYVDLQEQLASMEAARERLREIVSSAETVEDLLLAERYLTERETEIASITGRLEYLAEAARLSKIDIELHPHLPEPPVEEPSWQPGETARNAFEMLVTSVQVAIDFAIGLGIVFLPWLAAIGLVVYGVRYAVRRYRGPRGVKEPSRLESEKE